MEIDRRKRPFSSHRFFPLSPNAAETDVDLRRDITLLTVLLNGVHWGASKLVEEDKHVSSSLELWSNVSFVLTTGSREDPFGTQVAAVHGQIEPGSVNVTVIHQDIALQHTSNTEEEPVSISSVPLLNDETVAKMFDNLESLPFE